LAQDRGVSIVIPAMNEAKNLPALLGRIDAAMAGRSYEAIIVDDDSRDGTPEVCQSLIDQYPVRLVVRKDPSNGLSGAVLHGMGVARGELLVVMDADLQHPPETIPDLLAPLESGEAEFVLGSRYVAGGSTEENWSVFRRINSRIATLLARPFARGTRDPMSGFFSLRAETFRGASRLTPIGYKIALEMMCKCRVRRVCEVPIHFGNRAQGESKLSLKQQVRYLRHLARLYHFTFPRAVLVGMAASGATGGWMLSQVTVPAMAMVLGAMSAVTLAYSTHRRSLVEVPTRRDLLGAEIELGRERRGLEQAA
jgi:dolichol-phosphate mannosyltransferase